MYRDALNRADIVLDNLDDILDRAMLIGNGDINALVYGSEGDLFLNLTKNDVWDARRDTSHDLPLMSNRELKEQIRAIGDDAEPGKDLGVYLASPDGIADSYHRNSYPCPRICGQARTGWGARQRQ